MKRALLAAAIVVATITLGFSLGAVWYYAIYDMDRRVAVACFVTGFIGVCLTMMLVMLWDFAPKPGSRPL